MTIISFGAFSAVCQPSDERRSPRSPSHFATGIHAAGTSRTHYASRRCIPSMVFRSSNDHHIKRNSHLMNRVSARPRDERHLGRTITPWTALPRRPAPRTACLSPIAHPMGNTSAAALHQWHFSLRQRASHGALRPLSRGPSGTSPHSLISSGTVSLSPANAVHGASRSRLSH